LPLQPTETCDHGILQAGGLLGVAEAIAVAAAILERQRIRWRQIGIQSLKRSRIRQQPQPFLTVDAVMMATALADAGIGQQILAIHHQGASRTFAPEPIPVLRLLGLVAAGHRQGFAAISKPVEQRHCEERGLGKRVGIDRGRFACAGRSGPH
jgi:hypothetical protein